MAKTSSLRLQIGLLYTVLAFVNIVFFSVVMYENQSDLLVRSFQIQTENLAKSLLEDFLPAIEKQGRQGIPEDLWARLSYFDVTHYRLYKENGELIQEGQLSSQEESVGFPEGEKLEKIFEEWDSRKSPSLFQSKYHIQLQESDFSAILTFPIFYSKQNKEFLQVRLKLVGLQERFEQIVYFILVAVAWGILFHLAFAIFVYKVIFTRLGILKEATEKMSSGNLEARAIWKFSRNDELDELGKTFNSMAQNIQENVEAITRLNNEINQELMIGKEVQEFFLPNLKKFSQFQPAIFYRPMREVSGDIYYFYKNPKTDEFAFFLADASGHGVSAALITVTILMFLEDILKETTNPELTIQELNKRLSVRLESSFFATAVLILIHGNQMVVCNGGHSPIFLYSQKEKSWMELPGTGPPLGLDEDYLYKSSIREVFPGDKVFLYTDGLIESQNKEGKLYGKDRLKSKLQELMEENPKSKNSDLLQTIQQDLEEFKKEYKDDVTIILLEIP